MTFTRRILFVFVTVAALLSTSGCSVAEGETATWELTDPLAVSAQSERIGILVSRLECASGVTGETLPPVITYSEQEVVVRVDAQKTEAISAGCPANDRVPVTVELREPLGRRDLIDGACVEEGDLEVVNCEDGGVRASATP